jgi:hypothetical protein
MGEQMALKMMDRKTIIRIIVFMKGSAFLIRNTNKAKIPSINSVTIIWLLKNNLKYTDLKYSEKFSLVILVLFVISIAIPF